MKATFVLFFENKLVKLCDENHLLVDLNVDFCEHRYLRTNMTGQDQMDKAVFWT